MRSVDAINGEIGQLRGQIRKHEARIADLYKEVAEVEMTAKGFKIGQTVEWPHGRCSKKERGHRRFRLELWFDAFMQAHFEKRQLWARDQRTPIPP